MTKNVVHRIPGLVLTDRSLEAPLDHAHPGAEKINLFTREVVATEKEAADLPWLVFFQGGPGFEAPRPMGKGGWIKRLVQDYRVLLLDQRGTGRSTPITYQTLRKMSTPEEAAGYLKNFRADSIIRDAELIRRELLGENIPWSILGQSFGGFCAVHYLSKAPYGLKEAIITGGLPPLDRPVDDVYFATYQTVLQKNNQYFERYPEDQQVAQEIASILARDPVKLPGGGILTVRRFQQLGMGFGANDGFEQTHYLLESAFVDGPGGLELGYGFLREVENYHSFETNPIYALLHEACYCQEEASNWSAERVRQQYPEFQWAPGKPFYFTGEMIYPWMFEDYERLRPMREAAEILAQYEGWPRLYDQGVLEQNTVPCAAALYYNDMYVERKYSEEAARTIRGLKVWVTNEYEHNGLRADGENVLNHLFGMLHGE